MRLFIILLIGVVFGITLSKGEIISWFRIQEMFRFQSFHMYGVIGSAVALGVIVTRLGKAGFLRTLDGGPFHLIDYPGDRLPRYMLGGIIFGIGWAFTGACPGPMYILVGNGFFFFLVVIAAALAGALAYGALRSRLPHRGWIASRRMTSITPARN